MTGPRTEKPNRPTNWHLLDPEEVLEKLRSSVSGLSHEEARRRLEHYGPNQLIEKKRKSLWMMFLDQFKDFMILVLIAAAIVAGIIGEPADSIAIAVIVLLNAILGFVQEYRAEKAMAALKKLAAPSATALRDGQTTSVPAEELVPGDMVILEAGNVVPADIRLTETFQIRNDEAALTGESVPVEKDSVALEEADLSIGDRKNMAYKGTLVTYGRGRGLVTDTGMETELGKISDLVQTAEDETTPLEKRLDMLARKLLWVTLGLIVIIALTGTFIGGQEIKHVIEMAIALAVAAIPEGLPIVATLALARGMLRMAKRNALVNELAAVETLGGVSVICTDKTGTLTENKMTVTELVFSDQRVKIGPINNQGTADFSIDGQVINAGENNRTQKLLEVGVLCNNASLNKSDGNEIKGIGDPLEVAFLVAAQKAGIDYEKVNLDYPEQTEDAFDSDTKKMATFNKKESGYWVAVKGAMEVILADSTTLMTADGSEPMTEPWRQYWQEKNLQLAEKGYRVLAFAMKHADTTDADPYDGLEFIGLGVMEDPARQDVKEAIEQCRSAGIRTVMITGDHPKTAASIAASIRLSGDEFQDAIIGKDIIVAEDMSPEDEERYRNASVFARVSPKQKLDLIAVHQNAGAVVAMTGDGVNDAPALKKADIGIAMGRRGTQVAQEAADMVLKDDAFSTIIVAVEQGRIIFENIRKFVVYLLSCNLSEVMVVFAASLVSAPLPLLPLQILFLNLVTDVFPALALGAGKGSSGIMKQKPRSSDEPILPVEGWFSIVGYGALMSVAVLVAFWIGFRTLGLDEQGARTISFLTLAFAQLWHIFNMRGKRTHWADNEVVNNKFVWAAIVFCSLLLVVSVYTPMARVLDLTNPGLSGWLLVLVASAMVCAIGQVLRVFTEKKD